MITYLGQRLAWALAVLVGISLAVFLVVHLSGDPTALYMGPEGTKADYEILRRGARIRPPAAGAVRALPLARGPGRLRTVPPAPAAHAAAGPPALPGDGRPRGRGAPCWRRSSPLPLGILAAVRRGSLLDSGAMVLALAGQCMPTFWLGILLILVFAVNLRWVPVYGGEGRARRSSCPPSRSASGPWRGPRASPGRACSRF